MKADGDRCLGTGSDVGKSVMAAALCRLFDRYTGGALHGSKSVKQFLRHKGRKEWRLSIFMMGEKPARVFGMPCKENRASLADRVRHRKGREALTIERRYSFPAGSTMSSSRWDKRCLNPERVSVAGVSSLRHIQIIVEAGTSQKAFCEISTQLAKHIGTGARFLSVRAVTTQSAYRPT